MAARLSVAGVAGFPMRLDDQANQCMRRHARNNNASLRVVAEAIVAVGLRV
jgi:hypothetical protein